MGPQLHPDLQTLSVPYQYCTCPAWGVSTIVLTPVSALPPPPHPTSRADTGNTTHTGEVDDNDSNTGSWNDRKATHKARRSHTHLHSRKQSKLLTRITATSGLASPLRNSRHSDGTIRSKLAGRLFAKANVAPRLHGPVGGQDADLVGKSGTAPKLSAEAVPDQQQLATGRETESTQPVAGQVGQGPASSQPKESSTGDLSMDMVDIVREQIVAPESPAQGAMEREEEQELKQKDARQQEPREQQQQQQTSDEGDDEQRRQQQRQQHRDEQEPSLTRHHDDAGRPDLTEQEREQEPTMQEQIISHAVQPPSENEEERVPTQHDTREGSTPHDSSAGSPLQRAAEWRTQQEESRSPNDPTPCRPDIPAPTRMDNWGPEPGLSQSHKASQLVSSPAAGGGVRIRPQLARNSPVGKPSHPSATSARPAAEPSTNDSDISKPAKFTEGLATKPVESSVKPAQPSTPTLKPSEPMSQPTPPVSAILPPKPTPNPPAQPTPPIKPPPPTAADNTQQATATANEADQLDERMQPSVAAEPAKPEKPQQEAEPTPLWQAALTTLPPKPTPDHPDHPAQPSPPTKAPQQPAQQPAVYVTEPPFIVGSISEPSAETPAWWNKVPEPQQKPQPQPQAALQAPEFVTAPQPQPTTASVHVKAPEPSAEAPSWWSKVPEPQQKPQPQPQAALQTTEPVTVPEPQQEPQQRLQAALQATELQAVTSLQPQPTVALPEHLITPEPTVEAPTRSSKVPEPQQKVDAAPNLKALVSVAGPQQPVVAASGHPFTPQPTAVPQQEPQTATKAPKHVAAPQQLAVAASGHPFTPQPTAEAKPQQEHQTATKAIDPVAVVQPPAAAGSGRSSTPEPTPEPQQKPEASPNTATTAEPSTAMAHVATATAAVRPDAQGPNAEHPIKVPGWAFLWTSQHTRAPSIAQPSYTN